MPEELSKNALLLWGMMLCSGDLKLKVKTFYEVLQDSNQSSISANDKDFGTSFSMLIDLAIKVPNFYEVNVAK